MKQTSNRTAPKDLKKNIVQEQETIRALLLQMKNQIDPVSFSKYEHLLAHIAECSCHEYQADGVPCSSSEVDCHECEKALADLTHLRQGLNQDFK